MYKVDLVNDYDSSTRYFEDWANLELYITNIIDCSLTDQEQLFSQGITHVAFSPEGSIFVVKIAKIQVHKETPTVYAPEMNDYELYEVFPRDYLELKKEFKKFINSIDEDTIDSYRIGLVGITDEQEYENANSCCGSTDVIVEINSKKYKFGCNYGH